MWSKSAFRTLARGPRRRKRSASGGGADEAHVLSEIRRVFDAEWESPTSAAEGEVVPDADGSPPQ